MPTGASGTREAQQPDEQQLIAAIPAVRTQLDYDMVALLGIRQYSDLFGGMRGISEARAAQFEAFSSGAVGSISGTGLSEGNLRRLQEKASEALSHGIVIEVDMENRRFEITNTNYAPISAMAPEEHAALLEAVKAAQGYLKSAEELASQGRQAEASQYVARALQVQEIYSLYVEGLMGREAAQKAQAQMENAPRAGGSGRVARELVEMATGERLSGSRLAAEFERVTGLAYDEFIVREVDGGYAGKGIAGVAAHNYSDSVAYVDAGLGALNSALQMVYDGTSVAAADEYGQQVSLAAQNFGYAAGLVDAADSMMRNVYLMMASRSGAAHMDSLDIGDMLSVTREVAYGHGEIERMRSRPEVRERETERVMIPGAYRHYGSLDAERLSIKAEYAAAESDSMEAALYRMITPQTQDAAEQYLQRSVQAEAGAVGHLSQADASTVHLQRRVASILAYEPIWQQIHSSDYTAPLRLADPSGELMAERDRISEQLDAAMRDGTEVEGLDVQLRGLDYLRSAASLERYQFPEVTGEKARAGLERLRDGLVQDLRRAASEGAELDGLEERRSAIIAAETECVNFEQAVRGAAGRAYAVADSLREGIRENNERVSGALAEIPDEVVYEEKGRGDMASREVRVDLRDNKRVISERLEELGRHSERLAALEGRINAWADATISSYEPSQVVRDSSTFDLEGRYGMGNSRHFAALREIDSELRDIGRRVSASIRIVGEAAQGMAEEYRQGLDDARQAAMAASGIDLADPFSWAAGGALFRGGQLAWRGVQAAWAGITAKAAQQGSLALAARGTELVARSIPTAGTIAQNTYAAYTIANAENFDEVMEGASWMGALGSTGGLVGLVGKGARYLSIAADSIAVTAMVAGVSYQAYEAFSRGGGEWWDLARVGAMGALGAFGGAMGLAGSLKMRVPGGFRDVLPSGLIGGRVIRPEEAVRAGSRAFGEAAGEVPLRQMAPIERENLLAAERAAYGTPAGARAQIPPTMREIAAPQAAEDLAAAERLAARYREFERSPGGRRIVLSPEVAELGRVLYERPGMRVEEAALEYVRQARNAGRELPAWMRGVQEEREIVPIEALAQENIPAAAQQALARAETIIAAGPPVRGERFVEALGLIQDTEKRAYLMRHFSGALPDEISLSNALAVLGERSAERAGIAGDLQRVMTKESIGGNAGPGHVAVNGYFDDQGRIIAFGNVQDLPADVVARGRRFALSVDVATGRIDNVLTEGTAPQSILSLRGMQVSGVAGMGEEATVFMGSAGASTMAHLTTHYAGPELEAMIGQLNRMGYVVPRAGTEMSAPVLYEEFIRQHIPQGVSGNGIIFRIDLSGVRAGNMLAGTEFTDMSIGVRMRGIREAILDAVRETGEEVTPIFTRRSGQSDELMVVVFGPGDAVLRHADDFRRALESAPSRVMEIYSREMRGNATLFEIAEGSFRHPEAVAGLKFDMAAFSVDRAAGQGFLTEAARASARGGSAAHGERVMAALGIQETSLLFEPNPAITRVAQEEQVSGAIVEISMRIPEARMGALERSLGEFLSPARLEAMVDSHVITEAESAALRGAIERNGGRLTLADAAQYLFRKGTGQALSGEARTRLLNSLLTEEGFNVVATEVDNAVAAYARAHHLSIRRASGAPSMQYIIEGASGEAAEMHRRGLASAVYDALAGRGIDLIPSARAYLAPEGLLGRDIEIFLSTRRIGDVEMSPATYFAADYAVALFEGGTHTNVDRIINLLPEQSRHAMREIVELASSGRGIKNLHDLYEVLKRSDPALFENFIRNMQRPEVMEEIARIMPRNNADELFRLMQIGH